MQPNEAPRLEKTLGGFHLWGIAVGLVISGEYFGWSYGWATAGTLGFLISTLLVTALYVTFVLSFAELATALPQAGGPFVYATRALGPRWGFVAGIATLVEFVFAPPAIALSMGAYLNVQFPSLSPQLAAVAAYVVFMGLNLLGVTLAATFELVVTLLAIAELCVFIGLVGPHFCWERFAAGGFGGEETLSWATLPGIFAALPFAMWFFLAIEGAALAAEEVRDPMRVVPRAFLLGILTLVVLAFGVMFAAGGVGDWRELSNINDPLPHALERVVGTSSGYLHMLVWIGLFGLVASFHGIVLGYSRQIFALARAGQLPSFLARVHPRFHTPGWAILAGGVVGGAAIFSDSFLHFDGQPLMANLVSLSVFGALVLYVLSMISLLVLRRREPELARPYRAPFYPVFPFIALVLASVFLVTLVVLLPTIALAFAGILGAAVAIHALVVRAN